MKQFIHLLVSVLFLNSVLYVIASSKVDETLQPSNLLTNFPSEEVSSEDADDISTPLKHEKRPRRRQNSPKDDSAKPKDINVNNNQEENDDTKQTDSEPTLSHILRNNHRHHHNRNRLNAREIVPKKGPIPTRFLSSVLPRERKPRYRALERSLGNLDEQLKFQIQQLKYNSV